MKATQTTVLILSLLAAACGGKTSIASKSAAAYRSAVQKGIPVSEGGHGGHQVAAQPSDHSKMAGMHMPGMDHSKKAGMPMPGMDHTKMSGMDHANMAGMDHTKMAGMDHANMPGMEHSGSMAGMQHGGMSMQPPPNVDLSAPTSNADIRRLSPSSTLRADDLDAPAAVAVSEAAKAAQTPHHQ
ncbi:MAG TPA: hypothetical protein VER58_00405 [Thermoanaerobaculia bacterium]|nr:hypothetical protein [Thermoanaerobaculia bacterium]